MILKYKTDMSYPQQFLLYVNVVLLLGYLKIIKKQILGERVLSVLRVSL